MSTNPKEIVDKSKKIVDKSKNFRRQIQKKLSRNPKQVHISRNTKHNFLENPEIQKSRNPEIKKSKNQEIQKSKISIFWENPKSPQKSSRFDTSGSQVALFVAEISCALDGVKNVTDQPTDKAFLGVGWGAN